VIQLKVFDMSSPTISQLTKALRIQEQIEKLEAELRSVLSGSESTASWSTGNGKQASAKPKVKKKSGMSAEGRARIAAAQRARWAKSKGEVADTASETSSAAKETKPAKKKRRKMSAEARQRIIDAQKKRWAKVKASKK